MNNQGKVIMLLRYAVPNYNRNSRETVRMYTQQYPGQYHHPHSLHMFEKLKKH